MRTDVLTDEEWLAQQFATNPHLLLLVGSLALHDLPENLTHSFDAWFDRVTLPLSLDDITRHLIRTVAFQAWSEADMQSSGHAHVCVAREIGNQLREMAEAECPRMALQQAD